MAQQRAPQPPRPRLPPRNPRPPPLALGRGLKGAQAPGQAADQAARRSRTSA
jgi:hypothetical protein